MKFGGLAGVAWALTSLPSTGTAFVQITGISGGRSGAELHRVLRAGLGAQRPRRQVSAGTSVGQAPHRHRGLPEDCVSNTACDFLKGHEFTKKRVLPGQV